ncbi:sodium-dependent transporter [Methanofollis aquaemaris]|uniref:Transporter n=1 Tax=Methanofollis aquaemaris TaxID=126734 RepID=A0A8A3S6Y4_9EURY|nr:sodium-dependent transporter [Methanofollis aquaemaris]QSZ67430.1 sodium-dependent transporter [Methanofollis aquaemaris]
MNEKAFWSSRLAFILAAIGAAIGIGNVWRFPYMAYSNGGGAFLIPYTVALATAGIPLLIMEFGLGYKAKAGAPLSFRKLLGERWEWIGWMAVLVGFLTMTYYCTILAWAADYTVFSTTLAYAGDPEAFFFGDFLGLSESRGILGDVNWLIVAGAAVAWLWIYVAVIRGVRSVEKMAYVTVVLPWLLILLFVVRGITLPGAMDGIAYYLTPDFSVLLDPQVWLAAYGQIFFTLSLGWGVMIAYASYLPDKSDIGKNAVIIAVANSVTSIVAGLAVFSTLGYMAHQAGVPVTEVVRGGIELAFVTYPAAIQLLPFGAPVFGVLFFFMLLALGIASAFATIEAVNRAVIDQTNLPRRLVVPAVCISGFLLGLFFATSSGYQWLDIVDHYLSFFALVLVGALEAVAVGHLYGADLMRRFINANSEIVVGRWWDLCIRYVAPVLLFTALGFSLVKGLAEPYGGYPLWANAFGWVLVLFVPIAAVAIARAVQKKERRG